MLASARGRLSCALAVFGIALLNPIATRPVCAQTEWPPAASLTLRDVYDRIDEGTPTVRAAEAIARAADARVHGTRRPPDPFVQLGLMNYLLPDLGADPVLGMRQVQVMQMIPLPGKLAAATATARARALSSAARVDETRAEARAAAAMAFIERWSALQQAVLTLETRRLLEDAAAVATAMYRVGDAQQADVLRAQVEMARMEEMALRMQAMADGALARLAAVLDVPSDEVAAAPESPDLPDSHPSMDSLTAAALGARPMLAAGAADVEAASAQLRLARRERWPDPQVGLQYGSRRTPMGTEHMASFMIGAAIPIWARSRQMQMGEEAAAMRAMAESDLATVRADTRGRVGAAHAAIASARRLAALYRSSVLPQAEAAATSALSAYRAGAVDFMTVIENRMTVSAYRQELIALHAAEALAWVELEMLLGRPLLVDPSATGGR